MFCKFCGSEIEKNARFCVSCGKKIEDNNIKKDKWKLLETITKNKSICLVLGLLGVIVLIAVINNQNSFGKEGINNALHDKGFLSGHVDDEIIEKDFSFLLDEIVYNNKFSNTEYHVEVTEIEQIYSDDTTDSFAQRITIEYELFTRIVKVSVTYILEENEWLSNYEIIEDKITLSSNLNGYWVKEFKASHPMHIDSIMTINIEQQDEYSCYYDYFRSSAIPGGYDQSFSKTCNSKVIYEDENGFYIDKILLASDSVHGKLIIMPEGLMFDPELSANGPYKLDKQE